MKSRLIIALGVLVVVSLGGYLWTVSQPSSTGSTNTNSIPTSNISNIPLSSDVATPILGDYGVPSSIAPLSSNAVAAGIWDSGDPNVWYEAFQSDGRSVQDQAQGHILAVEDVELNQAIEVNGRTGWQILGVGDLEVLRTYVIDGNYLFEIVLQADQIGASDRNRYNAAVAQLTFIE